MFFHSECWFSVCSLFCDVILNVLSSSEIMLLRGHARVQRGGGGVGGNQKAIGFLSNTAPDPMGNHKATYLAIIAPPAKRHKMAFRWRADEDPL